MNDTLKIVIGLLIPLAGTVPGAAMVFFLKGEMKPTRRRANTATLEPSAWL